jgi:arginine:pyruvate transaminase
LKLASVADRLSRLGSEKWAVHIEGKRRAAKGDQLIFLSIGEPDLPPPPALLEHARQQIKPENLHYASGRGETILLQSLAHHYTRQTGRTISPRQFLYVPGTQTALYLAFQSILDPGDEVLMLDPYYATYEAVVTAPGGLPVAVPLDPERGFHITREEILAVGDFARQHDLWIVSDEVYASQVHGNNVFTSPFFFQDLEERTIVVSSISKSHAVPGFRSGWIAASEAFCERVLPVAETMLFGSQAFLENTLSFALDNEFSETKSAQLAYLKRAKALMAGISGSKLKARMPEGGMFVMLDVRATGLSGNDFARKLLAEHDVVTMPGESFGQQGAGHLRVALTVDVRQMTEAARRMVALANSI